jgi:N-acetyl-anhydromuramyl-L-alanine amidase AmpD
MEPNRRPRTDRRQRGDEDEGLSEEEFAVAEGLRESDAGSNEEQPNNLVEEPARVESSSTEGDGSVSAFAAFNVPSFEIVWKGSPNFWAGRNNLTPVAIVDHIMQGTLDATTGWFNNPNSEASTHFGVGKDGRIFQFVRVENTSWGNGTINKPDLNIPWLADAINRKINPNRLTVSIEHEGKTGEPFSETMYQATLFLHTQLIKQLGIPVNRQHIVGHYQLDLVNRPFCPGTGFPWDRLMADLKAIFAPSPVKPDGQTPTGDPPGFVAQEFGPGTVNTNNAFVRAWPSFGAEGKVLRKLPKGTLLTFTGFTDQGPSFQNGTRWYKIRQEDGAGWIHSKLIS